MNGFKEVGFIYLNGHGIPPNTVDDVFKKVCALVSLDGTDLLLKFPLRQSAEFFQLPFSVKVGILLNVPLSLLTNQLAVG